MAKAGENLNYLGGKAQLLLAEGFQHPGEKKLVNKLQYKTPSLSGVLLSNSL